MSGRRLLVQLLSLLCLVAPASAWCRILRTVEIIHTSDLHASLALPGENRPGMMLKVASAIAVERTRFGNDRCLHIDTGDLLQGSIIGSLTSGMAAVDVLLAMGCDVWVPGNHDFDFGIAGYERAAAALQGIGLCGNLQPVNGGKIQFPAWKIFMRNGVKIAVIGATASFLSNWFLDDVNSRYHAISAQAMLQKVMDDILKCSPDLIILALHQGWMGENQDKRGVNEVAAIAKCFPQIDLILGGHTHRAFPGRRIGVSTWYMQPGANGEYIGAAEIECDIEQHRTRRISSRFLAVTTDLPDDEKASDALKKCFGQYHIPWAGCEIAPPLSYDISAGGTVGVNCPMSQLFCQALMDATDSDIALHGLLSKESIKAGEAITLSKLFAIVPYENTIVTCEVTQSELEAILTEQQTLKKSYTYCGCHGVTTLCDADGKVHVLGVGGENRPWPKGKRLRLALNSFTAAGGGRTPVMRQIIFQPECNLVNTRISTRSAMQKQLQKLSRNIPSVKTNP